MTVDSSALQDLPACSNCGHIHEAGGKRECGFSLDDSLQGLVRHWCECHDYAPLQDLDKGVEDARDLLLLWSPLDASRNLLFKDIAAFESSIVRREAGKVEAARNELESSQEKVRALSAGLREIQQLAIDDEGQKYPIGSPEMGRKIGWQDAAIIARRALNGPALASSDDSRPQEGAVPPRRPHVITWYCLGCEKAGVTLNRGGGHTIEGSVPDNCGPVVPLLNAEDVLDEAALRMLDQTLAEYRESLPRPAVSIPEINKEDANA